MPFPPGSMKGVTKNLRNLPDPAVEAAAPVEPKAGELTCPSCGAPFTLSATAAPSAEPPVVEPAPVVDDERPQRF
jgi:hypothetical protein